MYRLFLVEDANSLSLAGAVRKVAQIFDIDHRLLATEQIAEDVWLVSSKGFILAKILFEELQ